MKRIAVLCLACLFTIVSLMGCGGDGKIVKRGLRELVMADSTLVPGEKLAWYMAREDFLESPYADDALRADSEAYDETRVGEMENGMTDYTLKTEIELDTYKTTAGMMVLFNGEDELIRTTYRVLLPEAEKAKYFDLLNRMAEELDAIQGLESVNPELRGFSEGSLEELPVFLIWYCPENDTHIELQAMSLMGTLILDTAVYAEG